MRKRLWQSNWAVLSIVFGSLVVGSCEDGGITGGDNLPGDGTCRPGEKSCVGNVLNTCNESGVLAPTLECSGAMVCEASLGCVSCVPGTNTCVQNEVHACKSDGSPGELISMCDFAQTCRSGSCIDSCELAASEFVYLLSSDKKLLSFEPRNDTAANAIQSRGAINCPTSSSPNSMSVDRRAYAWLNFDDGKLYKIPTNNPATCADSTYQKDATMTAKVGMGFTSDTAGSKAETLFLATMVNPSQLWKVNPLETPNIKPVKVGTFAANVTSPEMTGTGAAELFAYFPATDANHRIIRVDKATGQANLTWSLPPLATSPGAWAFAHWGGRYYVFVTENTVNRVYRWDPNATGTAKWVRVQDNLPYRIVGAGVSTCAPTVVG